MKIKKLANTARLVLVEMPSRVELASRNIYNVCGASMHWQERGDYLCLKVQSASNLDNRDEEDWKEGKEAI